MKIIGILTGSDPRIHSGGVEKVIKEIEIPLKEKYKIMYIFINNKDFHETSNDIEYYGVKSLFKSPFHILLFTWKIKKFKLDLIIDNMGIANLYNNLNPQIKIIQICHAVAGGAIRDLKIGNLLKKIGYFVYYFFIHIIWKFTYKKADLVILAPEGGVELINKYYGVPKSKIKVIYNGVDFVNNRVNPFDKILKIFFISNNHVWRGIDRLEKVASFFKDKGVLFKIIGSEYLNEHNLSNIKYLGKLIGEEKYKEIIDSDVVFMPSCYEGQNLSVLEGMSMGCIPLVSKNTNTDMIKGTELEQFISLDNSVDFYIEKIMFLLETPDKINYFKQLSLNIIKDYTWENQSRKYLEVVDVLLK